MSREIKRVPVGFDWPLSKVWEGYQQPDWLDEDSCPDCENGYAPEAERIAGQWYGNVPFRPEWTGSTPFTVETPEVRAVAERNVTRSPEYYGSGEEAIVREAWRLLSLFNNQWSHHLEQADVDALIAEGRLVDFTHTWSREGGWQEKNPPYHPTAAEVNLWSLSGMSHDGINRMICVRARAEREGVEVRCPTCKGNAFVEAFVGQRKVANKWKRLHPPKGDGWQLWETTSEGSPISPAFATPEELARHIGGEFEKTLAWVTGPGWAPSGMAPTAGTVLTADDITKGATL